MRKQYPVPLAYKFLKSQTRLHISQELIHQVFHKLKLHHIQRFALCYSPLKRNYQLLRIQFCKKRA